jgi:nitrite reductase (NADH) large subunit
MKHVIIGNGVAGTTAAWHIRKTDPSASIIIITEEPYPFYSRIRLPQLLADETDETGLVIRKPDWYADNRIDLFLSTKVSAVDTARKKVISSSHEEFPYARLLLATGAHCFVPPVSGSDKKGVFTLRSISDALQIRDYIKNTAKRVLLIGGGVLGIEAGYGLMKAGCSITVVEVFPRLIPRQLDPAGAAMLQSRLESMGFIFHLGVTAKEIQGVEKAQSVLLADDRRIDCDLIIISAGIRYNLELPKMLSMTIDRGLVVNDRMETGVPDIYAAGDLIQHNGLCYGIWPAAEKQGEVAGINMAGGSAEYHGTTMSNTLSVAGIDIFSAGDIDADGQKQSIVLSDEDRHIYRKLIIDGDAITGAILLGDMRDRLKVMKALDARKNIAAIRQALSTGDFSRL